MTSLSVIGCGNHVIKNILPALDRAGIHLKHIFVRSLHPIEQAVMNGVSFDHFEAFTKAMDIYKDSPLLSLRTFEKNAMLGLM